MDPRRALTEFGGIASYRDLVAVTSRERIRTALKRGEITRINRDRYALPHTASAYADASRAGAYLSHLSAALHHGWAVRFPPHKTELTRSVAAPDRDGWATSPIRTLRDCATDLPFADALSVADSALRGGAVTHLDLIRASRRWPTHARRVAELAHEDAKNPFESSLRAIAIDVGLRPIPQWAIAFDGEVVHPDVCDPWQRLALEADSWSHHARDRADHDADCARYNKVVLAGWRVLRFTWPQVMFDRRSVERVLRATIPMAERPATHSQSGVSAA